MHVMDTLSPSMRDLARRLLAMEASSETPTDAHVHEAVRVCEKLRNSLVRFAGSDGLMALLRRALALARSEVPSLKNMTVNVDGRLEDVEEAGAAKNLTTEEAAAIIGHLLGLLATFIGEPLTLRLVRESWPDASLDEES